MSKYPSDDPTALLLAEMAEFGLDPKHILWDGRCHRFPGSNKTRGTDGWYLAYPDRKGAHYGCWATGVKQHWVLKRKDPVTPHERKKWAAEKRKRDWEQAEKREIALAQVQKVLKAAKDPPKDEKSHLYLFSKGINSWPGLQISTKTAIDGKDWVVPAGLLLVPMVKDGKIVNVQRIWPNGKKRWWPGAEVIGAHVALGTKDADWSECFIAEGWATGWTVWKATGKPVIVAFTSGNLLAVAKAFREKHPNAQITVAADNDRWTKIMDSEGGIPNPGIHYATLAAKEVGGDIAAPDFDDLAGRPTDFDDLRQRDGLEAVRKYLDPAMFPKVRTVADPNPAPDAEDAELEPAEDGDRKNAEAAKRDDGTSWFEDLPPPKGGGQVGEAISCAVESGLAYEFAFSRGGKIMFHWNGNWYRPMKKGRVPEVAVTELYAAGAGSSLRPIREGIEVMAGRIVQHAPPIDFDGDPYLVGLPRIAGEARNVLDLRDGTVRPARRTDYVSRSIGAAPDAIKTPLFDAAMARWADGDPDRIHMLRRIAVSCLVGYQPERAFFFALGPKGSGKTTFTRLVSLLSRDFFGALQATDIGAGKLQKPDELIYGHIAGKRGIVAAELPANALRGGFLKTMTGGDEVQARRLYGDPWTSVPGATLILTTNALPGVNVLDPALLDRVRVIQFPRTFEDDGSRIPKAELLPRLNAELPGILHKLLPDAAELIDENMTFPLERFAKDDREAVEVWSLSADKLMGFGNLLEVDPQGWIHGEVLWARFEEHCREVGIDPDDWKANTLSRELTTRGFGQSKKRGGERGRGGVRWKEGES